MLTNPGLGLALGLDCDGLIQQFQDLHQQRFGYCVDGDQQLVVEMVHVEVAAPQQRRSEASDAAVQPGQGSGEPALTRLHLGPAGWCEVPLLQRRSLVSGQVIHGPALISEAIGCIVLEAGWTARLDKVGCCCSIACPRLPQLLSRKGMG